MGEYVIAGLLAILVLWLLWLLFGIVRKEEIARHAVADTKGELATLQGRQDTLDQNLTELATERGQEATLRETYGVAKPGEGVIIVVPPKEATTTPKLPWWRKFLGWFHL
jgi:cell division protein FtsB